MPSGVDVVAIMRCVAEGAMEAGAHKLAHFTYARLQGYRLPLAWQVASLPAAAILSCAPAGT